MLDLRKKIASFIPSDAAKASLQNVLTVEWGEHKTVLVEVPDFSGGAAGRNEEVEMSGMGGSGVGYGRLSDDEDDRAHLYRPKPLPPLRPNFPKTLSSPSNTKKALPPLPRSTTSIPSSSSSSTSTSRRNDTRPPPKMPPRNKVDQNSFANPFFSTDDVDELDDYSPESDGGRGGNVWGDEGFGSSDYDSDGHHARTAAWGDDSAREVGRSQDPWNRPNQYGRKTPGQGDKDSPTNSIQSDKTASSEGEENPFA